LKGLSKKNRHLAQPILSKKEKKRAKEKEKLDRELLEAKGEESAKNRLKFATEITNLLFAIYFRVLKGSFIQFYSGINRLRNYFFARRISCRSIVWRNQTSSSCFKWTG